MRAAIPLTSTAPDLRTPRERWNRVATGVRARVREPVNRATAGEPPSWSNSDDDGLERQEERFLRALADLESVVSTSDGGEDDGSDNDNDNDDENDGGDVADDVEALAALIERGQDLPPRDFPFDNPPRESASSFIERLEDGLNVFRDVVEGRLKVGHILPAPPSESAERALSSFLTDVPDDRSTYPPEIPDDQMSKYTFGERVLYVLRRGYKSGSLRQPLTLLDQYGLLDDDLTLESPLCETKRGKTDVLSYCAIMDRMTAEVRCSNLLVAFPKLRDPGQFRNRPEPPVARATCDVILTIPVPDVYRSYLASRGEGYNPVSIRDQIAGGIDLAGDSPKGGSRVDSTTTSGTRSGTTATAGDVVGASAVSDLDAARRALADTGAAMVRTSWLTYPEQRAESETFHGGDDDDDGSDDHDDHDDDGSDDHDDHDVHDDDDDPMKTMTPDEAEAILKTLLGDDFDAIAQQLPRKRTTPPHVDPEYESMFDESARTSNELRLATTWTFEVDLVGRLVRAVTVDLSWANLGRVHERDLLQLVAFLERSEGPIRLARRTATTTTSTHEDNG